MSQSDFISENKGRFRDYYSIGTALGTGNLSLLNVMLCNRGLWRSKEMFESKDGSYKSSKNHSKGDVRCKRKS